MLSPFWLPAIVVGAGTLYVLPTVVALWRRAAAVVEVSLLNLCLGWTVFGWVCALVLAFGPRNPRRELSPSSRGSHHVCHELPQPYRDGVYIVSRGLDSVTWAIVRDGRWSIVYELEGADRVICDVHDQDVPLEILAEALGAQR